MLVGWILDVASLKSVLPGLQTMKANTAAVFVLLGTGLYLSVSGDTRRARRAIQACAGVAASVALLTLVEYAFTADFGIDELVFVDPPNSQTAVPGRMAGNTAVAFILAGAALVLGSSAGRRRRIAAQALSGLPFVIGLIAVAGYVFGVSSFQGIDGLSLMALHTALGMIVFSTGLLVSLSDVGFMSGLFGVTPAATSARRFIPFVFAVPFALGWVRLEGQYAGLYGNEFGLAIMVTSITLFLIGAVLWNAHVQFLSHEKETRIESERLRLLAELQASKHDLERRVQTATEDLRASEARHRALFDESPVALLESDVTAVLALLHSLGDDPQAAIERLVQQKDAFSQLLEKVDIRRANRASLRLFGAADEAELSSRFAETFDSQSPSATQDQLLALYEGQALFEIEGRRRTLQGELRSVLVRWSTLPRRSESSSTTMVASLVDVTEQRKTEQAIRDALQQREVLLREIHHRVKNNLAVISSLFYLESTYATDARTAALFEDGRRRVRSMALVHEALYGSEDLAHVDFGQYAGRLASELFATYGIDNRIHLSTEASPLRLSINLAVPCGLILNELITNAFKHAFPNDEAGTVTVTVRADADGTGVLEVRDDGIGFPPDLLTGDPLGSLGLRLIRALSQQIGGAFEMRPGEPGTVCRLAFPVEDADHDVG